MTLPIESILGIDQLTGIVADPMGGVPVPSLPAGFLTIRQPVESMTSFYNRVTNVRTVAQLTDPHAPAKPSTSPNAGKIPVTLAHSREYIMHGAELLQRLLVPGSLAVQNRAVQEVGRKTAELNRRFDNSRIATVVSALMSGYIYYDANGNLLPSSSGAGITVDFGVPANNRNNTNIGAWDTTSTDVAGQIETERKRLNQLTGLTYSHVVYGANIPGYLGLNDAFKLYIQGAPALSQAFASRQIPANFVANGLTWWTGADKWYVDADGTTQNWVGANSIVLLPEPSSEWYEIQEGPYLVPEDLGSVYGTSEAAVGGFASVSGRFSYAIKSTNPPGVQQFVGDTWLPIVKVPGAIRIVTNVTSAAT